MAAPSYRQVGWFDSGRNRFHALDEPDCDDWMDPVFVAEAGEVNSAPTPTDDSVCEHCGGTGRSPASLDEFSCATCGGLGRAPIDSANTRALLSRAADRVWPERTP